MTNPLKVASIATPIVQLAWYQDGETKFKKLPWRRPQTKVDLEDWMDDYFDSLDHGYSPKGFEQAPRPHYARIVLNGRVIAETFPNPKQRKGSLVGVCLPLGGGFSVPPAVHVPPQDEPSLLPKTQDPCDTDSVLARHDAGDLPSGIGSAA